MIKWSSETQHKSGEPIKFRQADDVYKYRTFLWIEKKKFAVYGWWGNFYQFIKYNIQWKMRHNSCHYNLKPNNFFFSIVKNNPSSLHCRQKKRSRRNAQSVVDTENKKTCTLILVKKEDNRHFSHRCFLYEKP